MIVEDDMLTIRAERMQERETNRRNYHLVERSVGVFQRSLRLPAPVDPGKVQASFDNGVLTVTIPKDSSLARSRRVQVRSGTGGQAADQGSRVPSPPTGSLPTRTTEPRPPGPQHRWQARVAICARSP